MKIGDIGPKVKLFQDALMLLGYPLPKWGADGQYGSETHGMADLLADVMGTPFDETTGVLPDIIYHIALDHAGDMGEDDNDGMPPLMVDYREEVQRRRKKKNRQIPGINKKRVQQGKKRLRKRAKPSVRPIEEVTGITLHQTATNFKGRVPFTLEMHYVTSRSSYGTKAASESQYLNDVQSRMWQAQKVFNSHDVGIEIDGYYSGVGVDPKYFWKPKSKPNRKPMYLAEEQVESTRQTVRYICDEIGRRGGEIKFIHAHRQTSDSRSSDPGSILWDAIGIWAQQNLGLSDGGVGKTWLKGLPIPEAWDPRAIGIPYR